MSLGFGDRNLVMSDMKPLLFFGYNLIGHTFLYP